MRQDYGSFVERHAQVVAIGPENAQAFRDYWHQHELPFIGLPDPTHSVLKLYGQQVNWLKLGRMPAQVVVDRQGIVRFVHYGRSMSDIPANQELLAVLDRLNEPVGPQAEPHRQPTS